MSVLEMVILLAFGIPIAVLSCAFVVLACRMQDREEKRACLRMEGVPRAYSLASRPSMVLLLPYLRQAYIHA